MTTALATIASPEATSRGLSLHTFDDMLRFAKVVSGTDFAPKDFRGKPEACLLAIQHGAEIGLSPMQSLQNIACINGRPAIWGDAALALVMGSPVCEFVKERIEGDGDQAVAICETRRRGYGTTAVVRFSVADAKRAGLWGKQGPWTQYPARMLQLRARGFALRDAFPDVLKGLITSEEAQDCPTPVEPAPAPQPEPKRLGSKPLADDKVAAARTAINGAATLKQLDAIVAKIEERVAEGAFTAANREELLALADGKAELIEGARGDAYEGPAK